MDPLTMAEAEEMGVPVCFTEEYAFLERIGQLPPYNGPVEPDWGSDAAYLYDDPDPDPQPCQGPPPRLADLGMPPAWHAHEPWCWDHHARTPGVEICPPPF